MIEQFVISEQFIDAKGQIWESNDTWEGEADIVGSCYGTPLINQITVSGYRYVNGVAQRVDGIDVPPTSQLWAKIAAHLKADTSLEKRFDDWERDQPSTERQSYASEHRLRLHEVM